MKTHYFGLVAFALLQSMTHAATVYSGTQNLTVTAVDLEGIYINFETGSIATAYPGDFDESPWLNITMGGYGIFNSELLRGHQRDRRLRS